MARHEEMMTLPVEKRRAYFRKAYALELGKVHAKGMCRWPIERLPEMVEIVMDGMARKQAPQGHAFAETKKFFDLRSDKAVFEFLGYGEIKC